MWWFWESEQEAWICHHFKCNLLHELNYDHTRKLLVFEGLAFSCMNFKYSFLQFWIFKVPPNSAFGAKLYYHSKFSLILEIPGHRDSFHDRCADVKLHGKGEQLGSVPLKMSLHVPLSTCVLGRSCALRSRFFFQLENYKPSLSSFLWFYNRFPIFCIDSIQIFSDVYHLRPRESKFSWSSITWSHSFYILNLILQFIININSKYIY